MKVNELLYGLKKVRDDVNEQIIYLEKYIEKQRKKERKKTFIEKQSFDFENLKNIDEMDSHNEEEYSYQIALALFFDENFIDNGFILFENKHLLFNEIFALINDKPVLKFVSTKSLINSFRTFFKCITLKITMKGCSKEVKDKLLSSLFVILKRTISVLLSYDKRHTYANMKEILPLENIGILAENLKNDPPLDFVEKELNKILDKINYMSDHCGWKVPNIAL